MGNVLDMKDIRYINLFEKITGVNTRYCFMYNDTIIFAVPRQFVSKSIGENGRNVKKINEITHKKIKIISSPESVYNINQFIKEVVSPVTFKDIELKNDEVIINAGSQSKAALIGRNKRRLLELQKIVKDFFKKDLRIV